MGGRSNRLLLHQLPVSLGQEEWIEFGRRRISMLFYQSLFLSRNTRRKIQTLDPFWAIFPKKIAPPNLRREGFGGAFDYRMTLHLDRGGQRKYVKKNDRCQAAVCSPLHPYPLLRKCKKPRNRSVAWYYLVLGEKREMILQMMWGKRPSEEKKYPWG